MKSIDNIYNDIKNSFYDKSKIDIKENSVIDMYTLANSEAINDAYKEIENNKNPYLFTKLKGDDIDSMGLLVRCARYENESDNNFLYRMMNWTSINEASNQIAIECALLNLKYSSNATYIPFTDGVGTGSIYVIPKSMDDETKKKAFEEAIDIYNHVASPGSYINIVIPKIIKVKLIAYVSIKDGNKEAVKNSIKEKVKNYINNIAPENYMLIGEIEKIGDIEEHVEYFRISDIYIDDTLFIGIKILQKISSKLILDDIMWLEEE